MTPQIRVRRHTDGRVALCIQTDGCYRWASWDFNDRYTEYKLLTDDDVAGDGWSELLVAELPEPDYTLQNVRQKWVLRTGELAVGQLDGHLECSYPHTANTLRSEALKMLAAAAACERYRAGREATTERKSD